MNATTGICEASIHAAWSNPQLARQVLRPRRDGCAEVALRLDGLAGARQILQLELVIRALPGVQRVAIDVPAHCVRVVWDRRRTPLPRLLDAIAGASGGSPQPLRAEHIDDDRSREMHDALKRLLVAGMCAMQVMTYAFVIYIGVVDFVDFTTRGLFRWLSLLTTAPLVFYSAQPFIRGAWGELGRRHLGINLPVALAVLLVFAASTIATVRGHGEIYFDSISMFVFLLLGARYLELRARHRSGALGEAAADATPLLASRRRADGSLETIAAIELLAGDRVHVADGGTVPADGVLESASVRVDEALLSGESRPVTRERGERLVAGSVLLTGPAELRVEYSGSATVAARLGALAERVRRARPGNAAERDGEVVRFVARVLALTVLTALGWLLIDPARAFAAAVAVLVVACPCSFALSRPLSLARALGVLAQRGVLVARGEALDTLARADYALFDKTGTLTSPQLGFDGVEPLSGDTPDSVLQRAAALARESSHPLARAVARAADAHGGVALHAHAVSVVAGGGIVGMLSPDPDSHAALKPKDVLGQAQEGRIPGHAYDERTWQAGVLRLGRPGFALLASSGAWPARLDDALLLADDRGAIAAFHCDERLRPDAAGACAAFRSEDVQLTIASGDTPARVAATAAALAIGDWHARQSPADKLALLHTARAAGRVTLAIGDGSNDAPLLAGADVSAALASGTDLAQAQADLLLLDGRLDGLIQARAIARQMRRIVAQSRRWSLVYNLCAVPFAALGLVSPWLAGIGMSLSSLAVVLNALRVGSLRTGRHLARPALSA
jgi:Cu2+-exporting ATPase